MTALAQITYQWVQHTQMLTCEIHAIEILLDEFSDDWFHLHRIALPGEVQRSVRKRRAEFFFGRYAAKSALDRFSLTNSEIGIGKMRNPVFPRTVRGSISHSSRLAAAVAVPADCCSGIGIDIESPFNSDLFEAVVSTAIFGDELALLEQWEDTSIETAVGFVFSAKESFYKATSTTVGRVFDFLAVRLERIDPQRQILVFRTVEYLCPQWPVGRCFEVCYQTASNGDLFTLFAW